MPKMSPKNLPKVVTYLGNMIRDLKEFIKAYSNRRSDAEISQMLGISIEEIKKQKGEKLQEAIQRPGKRDH